ncbi:hypothetical protein HYFRA_00006666 [Hymenoscyphus fraxineus]|uniref:MMS19 nucleotide excision repair protein n=1 Tax=Hymenoscyphus fraxineus TaxID=746836 RepID=A0A9N9KX78_9HELO|nr:hypothetical protein HYFRA_00006666 [Hymenoscyphus fraxineus]
MAEMGVRDWMEALSLKEGQALEERAAVDDISGCKNNNSGSPTAPIDTTAFDLGSMTFLEFTQDLEPYVGEEQIDLLMVSRGMSLFAMMLASMDSNSVSRQDTQLICEYLRARLENNNEVLNYKYGLNEVADSLLQVVTWKRFVPGEAAPLAKAIYKLCKGDSNTFMNQTPSTRRKYYVIIDYLNTKYQQHLERDMGASEFVTGLVELGAREKSALCLKDVFSLYVAVGSGWTLGSEDYKQLWDSFMRYFPITLTVTPNDQPTPDELRELLTRCFTANDFYAKEAFEKFLGELDIDQSANTKKQLLLATKSCVKAFSIHTLTEWASKIWDSLKFEIWNGENEEFIEDSLDIIHLLAVQLTNADWNWNEKSEVSSFIDSVVAEIFERLSDMKRYISGSERMLNAIASSSPLSLHLVMKGVFPGLCIMAQDEQSKVSKESIIGVFNSILKARVDIAAGTDTYEDRYHMDPTAFIISPQERYNQEAVLIKDMQAFSEAIRDLYFGAISELKAGLSEDSSMAGSVAQGFVYLRKIVGLLGDSTEIILETLNEVALAKTSSVDLQQAALKSIQEIVSFDTSGFSQSTLPSFLNEIPDQIDTAGGSDVLERATDILDNLVQIACSNSLNHIDFHESLLAKFDAVRQHKGQLQYLNVIIAASHRALSLYESVLPAGRRDAFILPLEDRINGPYSSIVLPLLDRVVGVVGEPGSAYLGLQNSVDPTQPWNDLTINLLGQMLTIAMLAEYHQIVVDEEGVEIDKKLDNILVSYNKNKPEGVPHGLVTLFRSEEDYSKVNPDNAGDFEGWPQDQSLLMFLVASLVAGINPKDEPHIWNSIGVVKNTITMIEASISTTVEASELARISFLYNMQLLVNKYHAGSHSALDYGHPTLGDWMLSIVQKAQSGTPMQIDNVYRTLAYYTAASLAAYQSGGSEAKQFLTQMIEGIAIPGHSLKISQSLRILLAPSPILTKKNFCTIRPLRQGLLFNHAAKELIDLWRSTEDQDIKGNYLVALAGILAFLDPAMLVDNVEMLFPAILEGTNCGHDEWTQETFIQLVFTLVPLATGVIEEHLDSVISRMTDRIKVSGGTAGGIATGASAAETESVVNEVANTVGASVKGRAMALEVLTLLVSHVDAGKLGVRKFRVVGEVDGALSDSRRVVRHKAEVCKMVWFNLKG